MNPFSPATLVAQAGHFIDPATGGVIPPIQPSTTYGRDAQYRLISPGVEYTRDDNPTYVQAERVIAQLEGGSEALLFSSGMAAITALFRTLDRGDHIVAPSRMYYGTLYWLKHFSQQQGVELTLFDPVQTDALGRAIQAGKTKLVWIETPANPTWEITDIQAAARLTRAAGAKLAVDSTVASPVLTRPLELGADVVLHSATKYLNGHSDVIAGALITRAKNALWDAIHFERQNSGAVLGAFEAWLLLRGIRTLFVRVKRACDSAMKLARHFETHPKLERVLYPGLANHPDHEIAKRQMQGGFGGMLSILVQGDAQAAIDVACRTKVFIPATSLGGVESLIEHRKTVEGDDSLTPDNLLRLSIGLESSDDLIADLEQALQGV